MATIIPDQGIVHYNVTEDREEAVWIPLRLIGEKAPGRECVVEVRTMDGTASGKCLTLNLTLTPNPNPSLSSFILDI